MDSHTRKKHIFCLGSAAIDCKLKSKQSLVLSTSNPAHAVITYGCVARNVAHTLANITQQIYLQSVVGHDEGQRMLSYMRDLGVNVDTSLQLSDQKTAHYYAILTEAGELHVAMAAMEIYEHIPFAAFTQHWQQWSNDSIIFMDTNLSPEIIEHAIKICKTKNICLCIDPVSTIKAKKLPFSLDGVFLLKPDQYEATALTQVDIFSPKDCFKAGKILLDRGVKNIVISLGKSGYVILNDKYNQHYPALNVDHVRDVSGAGDAFIAGILFGLQNDMELSEACLWGSAAAALTIQTFQTVMTDLTLADLTNKIDESKYAEIF